MITNTSAIVQEKIVDDGTTGGKRIYQTADGRWWEDTWMTPESSYTGAIVGYRDGDTVKW